MPSKTTYYIASFLGSSIGGYLPTVWGAGVFSYSSLFSSAIGGILAIILVMKLF